jgi:drug/metabolite transporter (DMT)-like permease
MVVSGRQTGVTAALAAALLFGITTPIAKQLLLGTQPLLIAGLLYLGSGVGVSILRFVQDRGWSPTGLSARDWPWLALTTLVGGIIAPALLMVGLSHADAASASLLLNLEVVFTAVLAWLVFREPANARVVLGLAAIFAGGLILVWPTRLSADHDLRALSLIAAACLCWAVDNNLTRKLSAGDARVLAAVKGLVAGIANTALAFALGGALPDVPHLLATALLGFLGYGLSLVMFIVSLRNLGAARSGAYFATAPFIGAAAAMVLSGSSGEATFWIAAVCMGIGVWLHVTESHEHNHTHEPLQHSHVHTHDEHHQHAHPFPCESAEPHTHQHAHSSLRHSHAHFPDIHHRHGHDHG